VLSWAAALLFPGFSVFSLLSFSTFYSLFSTREARPGVRASARYAILANVKRLGLFLILLGSLGCGKSLERQVQEQIRTFDHASLSKQQVEVQNVKEIGDHAVAEVRITTAVRLVKKDGTWVIEEFRIGDRRWERAEHILAVINEERTETTLQQLNLITE